MDSPTPPIVIEDSNGSAMDACFTAFDKDGDDRLNLAEFSVICRALFRNDKGHIYDVPPERLEQIFAVFDTNADGHIDREEFKFCWNQWIKTHFHSAFRVWHPHHHRQAALVLRLPLACHEVAVAAVAVAESEAEAAAYANIVRPVNAFLIVDVQNDFISGSLDISNCSAQQQGHEILEPINKLLDTVDFDAVFYSLDWHPSDHVSFIDNVKMRAMDESSALDADSAQVFDTVIFAGPPPMKQRLWPRHCVQDSWGAELHKDLKVVDHGIKVYKGTNPEVDSYSVFWDNKKLSDTTLNAQLKMKGATDIYVCGLAYDVCVGATAVDALSAGYRTILIDDCCRGTDFHDIEHTKEKVVTSDGVIVHTADVKAMAEGRDRRPELGYKLAMELKSPDSVLSQRNGFRPTY
ncbi:GL12667 [Drosophila persimilis]|uniref:nicotinamidase n=1 Tax=Drosophila persimilis TaxID=7234 RepID=B4GLY3_DROPE|nr:GL12667 [Drosophila persimilis]